MATINPPPGALGVENYHGSDPFTASSHEAHRQRYAAFDNSQFSLYLNGSPVQAKRALEAHLAETTRRLQETSHLGNALVQQRRELEEKLQEVDQQQQENDIGPELRQRLAELEKEFNDVGRETARAFLPKSRVPSGETDSGSGAFIYSSEAQHSPTKVSVPSRKQRNQQPARINDIALATEISTSLLSQLKDLQAVLLERDEALKAADLDRSQLEIEVEGLSQRLRTLDESESRLKDVNWSLETQVRESEVQFKSAADKEHRLNHALNLVRTEKSTLEREFEDLRQQFTKLSDDHINKTRQNETELTSLRRNVTMTEMEKNALQRKVEDLSNQNQDLAKAVAYRMKVDEHVTSDDTSPDDGAEERDSQTPEHSPPPSPNKATPRHGMLESETLKHSLQHAHRMIQQLKNNIHREKTEKIELKRMLQDARDELETNRGPINVPGSAGKRKKADKDVFKKPPRPDRLGALRSGTQEILDEDEWEEQDFVQSTPSRRPRSAGHVPGAFSSGFTSAAETSATEGFETANETSDAAFETANERDGATTETDAFLTGAETLDGGSSDELTETEAGPSHQVITRASRSSLINRSHHDSYESTASTSADEYDDDLDIRTPLQHSTPRFRPRTRPGSSRRPTPKGSLDFFANTPPTGRDSPASFASNSTQNTPAQGKSLFAELNDLSGDEDDGSVGEGTPSRSSVLFSPEGSPDATKRSILGNAQLRAEAVKTVMVDSCMMTEPEPRQVVGLSSVQSKDTQPQAPRHVVLHVSRLFAQDTKPQAPQSVALQMSTLFAQDTSPQAPPPAALHMSSLFAQDTSPQAPRPVALQISPLVVQDTSPQAPAQPELRVSTLSTQETVPKHVVPPTLVVSNVSGHCTAPRTPPAVPLALSPLSVHESAPRAALVPDFEMSSVSTQHTSPLAIPSVPLNMSSISMHGTEPRHVALPALGMSNLVSHETQPIAPVAAKSLALPLGVSSIVHQSSEPKEGTTARTLAPAVFHVSDIQSQYTDPKEVVGSDAARMGVMEEHLTADVLNSHKSDTQDLSRQVPLQLSAVSAHSTEPTSSRRELSTFSAMSSQVTEPFGAKKAVSQFSQLSSNATEPVAPRKQALQKSTLSSWSFDPVEPEQPILHMSNFSSQTTEPVAPRQPILQVSNLSLQATKPVMPQQPILQVSNLSLQTTEPVVPRQPSLQVSKLSSQVTEPVEVQKPMPPQLSSVVYQTSEPKEPVIPALSISATVSTQASEPVEPSRPAQSKISMLSTQATTPVIPRPQTLREAQITAQHIEPVEPMVAIASQHGVSNVTTLHDVQPESPTLPSFLPAPSRPSTAYRTEPPQLKLSSISSQNTQPSLSSGPAIAHRAVHVPVSVSTTPVQTDTEDLKGAEPPKTGYFDSVLPWSKDTLVQGEKPVTVKEGRTPLAPISSNAIIKSPRALMTDGGTQTMVSADQIDKLLLARNPRWSATIASNGAEKALSPPSSPSRKHSNELRAPNRPGSSSSMRSRAASPPPLPVDHKEVIAAAAKTLTPGTPGTMGPPMMPASAYKKRPTTPSIRTGSAAGLTPLTSGTTPRARRQSQRSDARSGASSPLSRRSSLSSFTSEVDQRFNMQGGPSFAANGMPTGTTDPRMIQAITQTMIGEYLWKYTRKTGREGLSENRHRRFFWIHPYTRTLYWSDRDPQTAGKTELKGKSVAIESVQEVEDDNPLPPGLHQKSLIIGTPGRSIKFTAPTGQRHETWFNALNYLCQRVDEGEQHVQRPAATDEIQEEFNGGYRSASRATGRSKASKSSYVTQRSASPHHAQIPTLRHSTVSQSRVTSTEPVQPTLTSRFSGILRPNSAMRGSFSSRLSRTSVPESPAFEEPSHANIELSRDIHDHVERDIDNMVNVRACCDGKSTHLCFVDSD
jgi:hypothetical protein